MSYNTSGPGPTGYTGATGPTGSGPTGPTGIGGGGGGISYTAINYSTGASANAGYIIDASAGAVTLTLPSSPSVGTVVGVSISSAVNTVTVGRNGKKILGLNEDATLSNAGDGVQFVFSGDTYGWSTTTEIGVPSVTPPTGPTGYTGPTGAASTVTGPTGSAGASVWGVITGTMSAQTDLDTALGLKYDKTGGTLTGDITINKADPSLILLGSGDASIKLGRIDGVASSPFLDWHSGATATSYDSRIRASSGNGAPGGGTLDFLCYHLQQNGSELALASSVSSKYDKTGGTLTGDITISKADPGITMLGSGDANIRFGRIDGVASSPIFDWHSGATASPYDVRMIASGGNGSASGGTLNILCADLQFNGSTLALASSVSSKYDKTGGTLTGNVTISKADPALVMSGTGNAQAEFGRVDGVASTPFWDWHSGATACDYDVRMIASGGNGSAGGGTLNILGALQLNSTAVTAWATKSYPTDSAGGLRNDGSGNLSWYPYVGGVGANTSIAVWNGTGSIGYSSALFAQTTSGAYLVANSSGTSTATTSTAGLYNTITYSQAFSSGPVSSLRGAMTLSAGGGTNNAAVLMAGVYGEANCNNQVINAAGVAGVLGNIIVSPNPTSTTLFSGLQGVASVTSGATANFSGSTLLGGRFTATFNTANTSGVAVATAIVGAKASPSVVTTNASGTNTIASVYGVWVSPSTFSCSGGGGLTITNYYGLYIDTLTLTTMTVTNRYGVYQSDSAAVNLLKGDVKIDTAGKGLFVKEGTNAKMGSATLSAGSVTVSTTAVTASSRIFITSNVDGGTTGSLRVSARTAGTSFTITSSSGSDTSTVAWVILEPA